MDWILTLFISTQIAHLPPLPIEVISFKQAFDSNEACQAGAYIMHMIMKDAATHFVVTQPTIMTVYECKKVLNV